MRFEPASVSAASAWVPQVRQRATSDSRTAEHQGEAVQEQRKGELGHRLEPAPRVRQRRRGRRPSLGSPVPWRAMAARPKWSSISRRYAECSGGSDSIGSWAVGRMSCSGGMGTRNGVAEVNRSMSRQTAAQVGVAEHHRELDPGDRSVDRAGRFPIIPKRVVGVVDHVLG